MATRVDCSGASALALCTSCTWREIVSTKAIAQAAAERHVMRAHRDDQAAVATVRKRRDRARA
jgi:hypothetical protein